MEVYKEALYSSINSMNPRRISIFLQTVPEKFRLKLETDKSIIPHVLSNIPRMDTCQQLWSLLKYFRSFEYDFNTSDIESIYTLTFRSLERYTTNKLADVQCLVYVIDMLKTCAQITNGYVTDSYILSYTHYKFARSKKWWNIMLGNWKLLEDILDYKQYIIINRLADKLDPLEVCIECLRPFDSPIIITDTFGCRCVCGKQHIKHKCTIL